VSGGEPSNSGDMTPAEAVAVARQAGVAVHTVQIGSDLIAAGREKVIEENPEPALAEISRLTGGRYWLVRDTQAAQRMVRDVGALGKTLARQAQYREVREWYWLPLALAALCLVLARLMLIRRQG
jgi:Ca-activated chloride channel homolog